MSDSHSVKQPEISLCLRLFVPVSSSALPPDMQVDSYTSHVSARLATSSVEYLCSRITPRKILLVYSQRCSTNIRDKSRDANNAIIESFFMFAQNVKYFNGARVEIDDSD